MRKRQLSGSRESNPGHTHPMRAHYHYATPRVNGDDYITQNRRGQRPRRFYVSTSLLQRSNHQHQEKRGCDNHQETEQEFVERRIKHLSILARLIVDHAKSPLAGAFCSSKIPYGHLLTYVL